MVVLGKGPQAAAQTGPACLADRMLTPKVRVGGRMELGPPIPAQADQFSQIVTLL